MKTFLSVLFVCILSAALVKSEFNKEEILKKLQEHANECMTKEGASKSDIDDLMQKKPAASKQGKCLRACIMTKVKLFDANGKFDKSVAMEHGKMYADGDAEKIKIATAIVDKCAATSVPADHCEAAALYGKCFKEEATAHGVVIAI